MPIKPSPSQYKCPSCNWSKVVRPQSDALTPLDYFDKCPKCGEKELLKERCESNFLDNLKDLINVYSNANIQNITYYAGDVLRTLNRRIAFAGFLSATITPAIAGAMVFGLDRLTGVVANTIGFGQQAATQAGTSVSRGDISMGNRNILNDSIEYIVETAANT